MRSGMRQRTGASGMNDSTQLYAYLLGDLPPEDIERIEQRILTDDRFQEEVEITEEELLDRYAQGRVSVEERRLFEQHFLASSVRKQRLTFARALQTKISSEKNMPVRKTARFSALYPYALVGCVLALLFLGYVSYRLSIQLQQQRSQTALLLLQIEDIRKAGASKTSYVDQASVYTNLVSQPLKVVELSPGVSRGTNLSRIVIPHGIRALQFALQVPKTLKSAVSVELSNDSGQAILSQPPVHPQQVANDNVVIVTLLNEQLPTGNYFLQVTSAQIPSTQFQYSFQIVH
jgi:hypothetical protein